MIDSAALPKNPSLTDRRKVQHFPYQLDENLLLLFLAWVVLMFFRATPGDAVVRLSSV